MKVITYDFETFYNQREYTLNKMGPIEYIRDPRFAAFMVSMAFNGCHPDVWCNVDDVVDKVSQALHYHINPEEDVLCAHNGGGFDHCILSERFDIHPRNMWDTIWIARWVGLSSIIRETHAALTEKLGNGIKQAGTVVSNDKHWPQDFSESEQIFFKQYCLDDTAQCQANLIAMLPYVTDDCLRFMSLTARMATEPVFELDAALLEEYIKQLDAEAEDARQRIMELFHFNDLAAFFTALRSKEKFAGMLRALGVEPPTKISEKKTATAIAKIEAQIDVLQAGESRLHGGERGVNALESGSEDVLRQQLAEIRVSGVKDYAFSKQDIDFLALAEHEDPRVRLLVETRLEFNSSVMRSRAETLLKFARQNKPLPFLLSAFLARTSRYTAGAGESNKTDGIQPQNFSKHNPAHKALRRAIRAPQGMKVVAVDSSQIECRFLAWMARQEDLLQLFREGKCPYSDLAVNFDSRYTAEEIYKGAKADDPHCTLLRQAAKKLRLSCQYGTGRRKFADTLWKEKTRLALTKEEHDELAFSYHQMYRLSSPFIVSFWRHCEAVIEALVRGDSGYFGGPDGNIFRYGMLPICGHDDWAVPSIMLPSGFALRYPKLRAVEGEKRIEYVYDVVKGARTMQKRLYGAALTENLTQAISFQLLMWQACRMDEVGVAIKGNNHDCWFTVVPEAQAQETKALMEYWMCQLPEWAKGLPVAAEGKIGDTFEIC